LLAIWLAAAASTRPARNPNDASTQATVAVPDDPVADNLNAETDRLQHRMARTPAVPSPGRNPFEFAPRARPVAPAAAAAAAALTSLLSTPPAKPSFTLVAIGQTGETRTAIVSAFDQVLLLKVGDRIASRFRIDAIGADAVEIVDTADNTPIRIGMK
jgi:hypothetical protein